MQAPVAKGGAVAAARSSQQAASTQTQKKQGVLKLHLSHSMHAGGAGACSTPCTLVVRAACCLSPAVYRLLSIACCLSPLFGTLVVSLMQCQVLENPFVILWLPFVCLSSVCRFVTSMLFSARVFASLL